jgi:hypothetical protein
MIKKNETAKIVVDDWFVVLYTLLNEKENLDYDDDYETVGHELVYHDGSEEVLLDGMGKIKDILKEKNLDFSSFSADNIFEFSKILSALYDLGKVVDMESKLYQNVAASKGVILSDHPLNISKSTVEFVVHRPHLAYEKHGFFKVVVHVNGLESFELERLCE